jgi:hypothetical protein
MSASIFGARPARRGLSIVLTLVLMGATGRPATGRPNIREAFFNAYPSAVGSVLDTVPSHPAHCGVCHYNFSGGGQRNLYGALLEQTLPGFPNTLAGRTQAVLFIQNQDPDGDGYSTLVEVTDTVNYGNTPTFPGLNAANVSSVTNVSLSDITSHLVPMTAADTTPPAVIVISPNGGEAYTGNNPASVQWTATDASGIAVINLYLSLDNGATYRPVALGLMNIGSHDLFLPNRPTLTARIRVEAIDNASNAGHDDSNGVFLIASPPGGVVPTTLRDFDQPGSQPFEAGTVGLPDECASCHGDYNPAVEPYFNWKGSMMAHASRDPLFEACMAVANQDAPDSGDLCLRCHIPSAWLRGQSVPTDGSQILAIDKTGVSCDFCHRLVDPIYTPGANPPADQAILAALSNPPFNFANGQYIGDPTGTRRGPFADAISAHPFLVSPFHREAALCGTCHDVSNPAFQKDAQGNYVPNAFDMAAASFASDVLLPIERTYSEWLHSEYNSPSGVYAPQFGGNLQYVSTCQDCHMRDVTGPGCAVPGAPVRNDLPLHDMTGGSTWLPGLLPILFPDEVDPIPLQVGIVRARYMLQNAATLDVDQYGQTLAVTVTNQTGHKLPSGYPEGRRIWLNVRFYDASQMVLGESGAYDLATGVLTHDAAAKIYEVEPGLDEITAPLLGVPPGPSFHFVLNNRIYKDNRIPPRGFTNAAFASFGGAPVAYSYADGQFWDDTSYPIPPGAASATVTLYYQSTSKEFIEFLRDANFTNDVGQALYDLWNNNGKCPPEVMAQAQRALAPPLPGDINGDGAVNLEDYAALAGCLSGPDFSASTECAPFDFAGDGDVDLRDIAVFAQEFTGT